MGYLEQMQLKSFEAILYTLEPDKNAKKSNIVALRGSDGKLLLGRPN